MSPSRQSRNEDPMTRPEFLEPSELSTEVVCRTLELVSLKADRAVVSQWSRFELLLAYDWAMRRHYSASDSLIRQRDKPWIVTVATSTALSTALAAESQDIAAAKLREDIRDMLAGEPDGVTTKDMLLRLSALGWKQLDTSVVQGILDGDDDIGMSEGADARWLWCPRAEVTP